ncbi:MAG: ABC transporter transmembrane domain-containing protein, partial [Nodosilinea sp.]
MASFQHVIRYYSRYRRAVVFSIAASSLFQIVDLAVPYCIGQILNVLSQQPVDPLSQGVINRISSGVGYPAGSGLALALFLAVIFAVTVVRAPIQPWLAGWFHWDIALRTRRDHSLSVVRKLLRLPLGFYDENNPGRIAGRVARGLSNHTWTYPE